MCVNRFSRRQNVLPPKWLATYEHWLIDFICEFEHFLHIFNQETIKTKGPFYDAHSFVQQGESRFEENLIKRQIVYPICKMNFFFCFFFSFCFGNLWFLFRLLRNQKKFTKVLGNFVLCRYIHWNEQFNHPHNKFFGLHKELSVLSLLNEHNWWICQCTQTKSNIICMFCEMFVKCFNKNIWFDLQSFI